MFKIIVEILQDLLSTHFGFVFLQERIVTGSFRWHFYVLLIRSNWDLIKSSEDDCCESFNQLIHQSVILLWKYFTV